MCRKSTCNVLSNSVVMLHHDSLRRSTWILLNLDLPPNLPRSAPQRILQLHIYNLIRLKRRSLTSPFKTAPKVPSHSLTVWKQYQTRPLSTTQSPTWMYPWAWRAFKTRMPQIITPWLVWAWSLVVIQRCIHHHPSPMAVWQPCIVELGYIKVAVACYWNHQREINNEEEAFWWPKEQQERWRRREEMAPGNLLYSIWMRH